MTREEALAYYQPIRASFRRILTEAVRVCNPSDLKRAAKLLGLWADEKIILPEGDEVVEMLGDIALFEPNQRGRRAYDVFLSDEAPNVNAADSQWLNGWALHPSRCSAARAIMRSLASSSKTYSTLVESFGSWTSEWKKARQARVLLACANLMQVYSTSGSGSLRQQTMKRRSSRFKA